MLPVALVLGARNVFAFFSTGLGQLIGVVAIAGVIFIAGDWRGSARERAACEVKIAGMIELGKVAAKNRDDRIRAESKADADKRIADIGKEKADLAKKVADYETELAKAKGRRACVATPADERGMRGL